jgi:ABC-type branched-subunit amino acid transport system substrate-binding protein
MTGRRIAWLGALTVPLACQWVAGIEEKESAVGQDAAIAASDASDAPLGECAKNNDCISQRGANWICVRPERVCRSLLDEACDLVIAGARGAPTAQKQSIVASDDTLFFGFVGDLRGDGKSAGIARRQALEMAVSDIHSVSQGLPGKDGRRRPIAFVACSETKDASGKPDPQPPARHLIDDLHVAAILGGSDGSTTIDLLENVARPKRTLVFSPNALASSLSSADDQGLFWRTTPPAAAQGRALRDQINALAEVVVAAGATAPLKLAIVTANDIDSKDLTAFARADIAVDGAPFGSVLVREYEARPGGDVVSGLASELRDLAPHIVVAIGHRDAIQIAAALEASSPSRLPHYLFAQGADSQDLTTLLTAFESGGIRARVRGTRPLGSPEIGSVFVPLYNAAFPGGPTNGEGVPATYDIAFLLGYAALAAGDPPLTGERIASALPRVLDPRAADVIKVGTSDLTRAMDALSAGKTIDVKGLSYTMAFDPAIGEPAGKVDVWCVSPANVVRSSGVTFDPAGQGTRSGTFACP